MHCNSPAPHQGLILLPSDKKHACVTYRVTTIENKRCCAAHRHTQQPCPAHANRHAAPLLAAPHNPTSTRLPHMPQRLASSYAALATAVTAALQQPPHPRLLSLLPSNCRCCTCRASLSCCCIYCRCRCASIPLLLAGKLLPPARQLLRLTMLVFLQASLRLHCLASLELVAKCLWGGVSCLSRGSSCIEARSSLKACNTLKKKNAKQVSTVGRKPVMSCAVATR
jgi:hypothetical protein